MSSNSGANQSLDQFKIKKLLELDLFGIDISMTNSSLYMILATAIICLFMFLSTRKISILPGRLQIIAESFYNFISNMIKNSIGDEGVKFFPLIF